MRIPVVREGLVSFGAAVMAMLLTACGSPTPELDPTPGMGLHARPLFEALPRPEGARAEDAATVTDGAIVRTYIVPRRDPAELIRFYGESLHANWRRVGSIVRLTGPALKATWVQDGWELTVTAAEQAPGVGAGRAAVLSLGLRARS